MFSKFEFCGYLNVWVFKILWLLKIYLYSKFAGLRFVGTQKIVGTQICWYSYSFIDTQILGHSHLWVLKICDDTKFQVSEREYIRTYVFSAYHVNRKTYVLFPYMLFAICAKTYHVN